MKYRTFFQFADDTRRRQSQHFFMIHCHFRLHIEISILGIISAAYHHSHMIFLFYIHIKGNVPSQLIFIISALFHHFKIHGFSILRQNHFGLCILSQITSPLKNQAECHIHNFAFIIQSRLPLYGSQPAFCIYMNQHLHIS